DINKTHPSYIISDIWKYSHLVAAAPSYNMGLYYPMESLLHEMISLGVKNRKVSIIGNHSWASTAQKIMTEKFNSMKNMEIIGNSLDINSRLKDDEESKLDELADTIAASVLGKTEE
ncbi:MAG TPA: FprA family A-type flavoprotein, partial [Proteiniclasticum sp.]|nr:FprA family A-type flavoprotein [Proteiniclasticum sp.]